MKSDLESAGRYARTFLFLWSVMVYSPTLQAQTNPVWSFAPDLTILMNKEGNADYGNGYSVDHAKSNLEFGIAALRRHYFIKPSYFSFEYGIRLHKAFLKMKVRSPQSTQPGDYSLDRFGASIPLRLFYGSKGAFTNRPGRQSGIFAGLLLGSYFGDDLLKNTYTSHFSLGGRTRGKRLYLQLSFAWPLLTTETAFTGEGQGFIFPTRERRLGLLTIGYQLQN